MIPLLFALIVLGIANTSFLYWQERQFQLRGREIYCIIGGKCQDVVTSKFGRTLGINNEILGLLYYFAVLALVLAFLFFPFAGVAGVILGISFLATLFSFYLLFLQVFVLRVYCSWCLIAIFINFAIFALEILIFV